MSTRGTVRVSETFTSRQGEGKLTGTETFFIRTSGCNLRCWYCDTPYASWHPGGEKISVAEIVELAIQAGQRHVVLTGGEPLLPPESVALCEQLQAAGFHLTIETAGTIERALTADLMSISPKLRGSTPDETAHPRWHQLHQQRRMPIDVMRRLIDRSKDFQLKFVAASPDDFAEIVDVATDLQVDASDVWIMPQGSTVEAIDGAMPWLKPWTQSQGFRYCDRMQIRWFGNRRGT
jgi:7-carboxy-7-deazaguanine synthase